MADGTAYQQQGESPERANTAIPDPAYGAVPEPAYNAAPDPAYEAVPSQAYEATPTPAPDPAAYGAPDPAFSAAPEPAYNAIPVIGEDGQPLPAVANLGATQNMEHVPLDELMPNAPIAEAPSGMQGEQAAFAEQFDQPFAEAPDQMQDASLMQPLPSSVAMDVDPIQVKTITVRTGRLVIDVEIPEERFRYTTPRLAAFTNGQYPDLPHHACVNDVGTTFGYVMERTSVAHLLEHLIISEQVRSQAVGNTTFVGTTEWTNEQAGKACVEVGFKDDLVALRAFNKATRFLNMAVLTCLA